MKKFFMFLFSMLPFLCVAQKSKTTAPAPEPFPFDITCDSGRVVVTIHAGVCHQFNTCYVFKNSKDSLVYLYTSKKFEKHSVTFFSSSDSMQSYGLYLESVYPTEPGRYYHRTLTCPTAREEFPLTIRNSDNSVWYESSNQSEIDIFWRSLPKGCYLVYFKNTPPLIRCKD